MKVAHLLMMRTGAYLALAAIIFGMPSCRLDTAIQAQEDFFYEQYDSKEFMVHHGRDTMRVSVAGEGPDTLVLVHGYGPLPRVQWQPTIAIMGDRKTLIVVDLIGFGESRSQDSLVSVHKQVAMIKAMADSLNISKHHIMGHSYGGMVATLYASLHEEKIKSVVLIDPLHRHLPKSFIDSLETAYDLPIEEILLPGSEEAFDALTDLNMDYPWLIPDFARDRIIDELYSVNRDQRQGILHSVRESEMMLKQDAVGADVPALIIWGERDPLIPLATADSLLADFPQGQLRIINGAMHLPQIERPITFMLTIQGFYDSLDAQDPNRRALMEAIEI